MEIETTPWHETRSLISPQIEMLQEDGMIQYKESFLKTESPKSATAKKRFIHYNVNYVKYCFLKEFYQFLGDGVYQKILNSPEDENDKNELIAILSEVIVDFIKYCEKEKLADNPREAFRAFCRDFLLQ
ncbi:hypothetical protein Q5692_39200 [Microcoleus sp. C2C3]|uniref:hypothetical protein n=1 Tax=unclassified Microcoleus TaxID=2642155 RepID=UPI002FD75A1D